MLSVKDRLPIGWKRVTGLRFVSDLYLMRYANKPTELERENDYILAKDYTVVALIDDDTEFEITAPKGLVTDLASVPRRYRRIVGRVGPHLEACIIHDWLYVEWQLSECTPSSELREFADQTMLAGMEAAGMGWKAKLIYWAVRLGGKGIFEERESGPILWRG